jgi:Na+-translocating ferredoxin:NAD+ oxidoreductase RnfC subunit
MSLLEKIVAAGVVGAGGAGFPTHLKLDCTVEYLLVNAAECEPLLHTDKYIMRTFAAEILEAVEAVAEQVKASKVLIAVKGVNSAEIASLQKAITKRKSSAAIFELENYYPAGDEQMLVYDITGRVVPPGSIPLKVGAVVSNVDTMLTIFDALHDRPVTHRYLTVAGAVKDPAVLKVPIGTSFGACIAACGGPTLKTFKVINGGPMMGKVLSADAAAAAPVTKTTSGILVIPDTGNFVARVTDLTVQQILNRAKAACIQCSFCTDLCPRQLIGHQLHPHLVMRKMATRDFNQPLTSDPVLKEALICSSCGICEAFACPMGLSPRQVNNHVKTVLRGEKFEQKRPLVADSLRPYRKIAPKKIMARMGLSELYANKPERFAELAVTTVKIPCGQHIGAPAVPVVAAGDQVAAGQLIARAVEGKPSANIHASIAGRVTAVGTAIEIEGGN